jgi:hypothetical protein
MPNAKPILMVQAKDSFATLHRRIRRGELVAADDPIVIAKPKFFVPYEPAKGR